ncbi:hypothetical protein JCM10296v2_001766 [Rhodotorula toruloides]
MANISTKHLTFEHSNITGTKGWSTLRLAAPDLEHLRLHFGTLPDSLPPGLLPPTLRTLDFDVSCLVKREAGDTSAMTSWLEHSSPLILSLPSLPNLVRLHLACACLTTDAVFALPNIAPRMEELLLPGTVYQDEELMCREGDEVFLDLVSSFPRLARIDLGMVLLRRDDRDELALTKEYCTLNRIKLAYERDDLEEFEESGWKAADDTD